MDNDNDDFVKFSIANYYYYICVFHNEFTFLFARSDTLVPTYYLKQSKNKIKKLKKLKIIISSYNCTCFFLFSIILKCIYKK